MPLADRVRPKSLDEVSGQRHLLGEGRPFRRIIESGHIPSMVFYGPPGTGKTTVADIVAKKTGKRLHKINATTAALSDIKAALSETDTLLGAGGILLYIDEIQYFNKKQQQSLLEYVEDGRVTLICSTTDNPYFCIFSALLSRSAVFEFKGVSAEEMVPSLKRAFGMLCEEYGEKKLEGDVFGIISRSTDGDVRKAINLLENSFFASGDTLSADTAKELSTMAGLRFDRNGEEHYDCISALQKSIRGSDENAAVFYLCRILEGGDLLIACRRLLVIACEDVGLAYPTAITVVKSCVDAATQLGLPEAVIPLAQATVFLATAPKSNSAYMAYAAAKADIAAGNIGSVPRHLQNKHADGFGDEREQGYKYPHDFENSWVNQQYLPDALKDRVYYHFGNNKTERAAKEYWEKIKGKKLN